MKKHLINKSLIRIILIAAIIVLSAFVLTKRQNQETADCDLQVICNSCNKVDTCDLINENNK